MFQFLTKKWGLQIRLVRLFHKDKKETSRPQYKCFGGNPVCIVWGFSAVQFSLWSCLSLAQSHPCDDHRSSWAQCELGAQAGAPSNAHSLLICLDQGLWAKTAACPAAWAGGSHPRLPSSSSSSQHTKSPGPSSCNPSLNQ